jgi:type I restriction enzyme M protein
VTSKFAEVDLHPGKVPNAEMGDLFEYLIYKFAEASNEEAGEHYTPRDAIRLMVDLLFAEDNEALLEPGTVRTIYDPFVMRNFHVSRDAQANVPIVQSTLMPSRAA